MKIPENAMDNEILASHEGLSSHREWHSVGAWLYLGESIVVQRASADDCHKSAHHTPEASGTATPKVTGPAVCTRPLCGRELCGPNCPDPQVASPAAASQTPRVDAFGREHHYVDDATYMYALEEFARTLEMELVERTNAYQLLSNQHSRLCTEVYEEDGETLKQDAVRAELAEAHSGWNELIVKYAALERERDDAVRREREDCALMAERFDSTR